MIAIYCNSSLDLNTLFVWVLNQNSDKYSEIMATLMGGCYFPSQILISTLRMVVFQCVQGYFPFISM